MLEGELMDKSYLYDDKMLEGLLRSLVSDGWFDDFIGSSMIENEEYEIADIPENPVGDKHGWQQLKERLQQDGVWKPD